MFIIRSRSDAIKDEVIKRLHENGKAIYATRTTPIYNNENIWFTADKNGKTLYAIYALSEGEELPETINGPAIFLTVK